jgi:transcriptional regulator with XRE-family HTH domain
VQTGPFDGITVVLVIDIEPHEALASNLHRIAFTMGLPLESVARSAGISLDELRAICTGEIDPDLEVVTRIAQAVGVRLSELFAEPTYN